MVAEGQRPFLERICIATARWLGRRSIARRIGRCGPGAGRRLRVRSGFPARLRGSLSGISSDTHADLYRYGPQGAIAGESHAGSGGDLCGLVGGRRTGHALVGIDVSPPRLRYGGLGGRCGFKIQSAGGDVRIARQLECRHRIVRFEIDAREMESQHPACTGIDHRRSRIAAKRRAVMRCGGDHLAEALNVGSLAKLSRLEALDVVDAAEHRILHIGIVAGIERRKTDDGDVAVRHVFGMFERKRQSGGCLLQSLDPQQGHVPIGMDHHHLAHLEEMRGWIVLFLEKIDAGRDA